MAHKQTWERVFPYFQPKDTIDRWGDPDAIDDIHLLRLYHLRVYLGLPIYILRGAETDGHSDKSWHYGRKKENGLWLHRPCATDIICPKYQGSEIDFLFTLMRFGFTGIGWYPHWKDHSGKVTGGAHVDSRPIKDFKHSRWMGVMDHKLDSKGEPIIVKGKFAYEQKYIKLTFHNILQYSKGGDDGSNNGNLGLH